MVEENDEEILLDEVSRDTKIAYCDVLLDPRMHFHIVGSGHVQC